GMGSEELFHSTYFELGLAMILIGLGFKVAAAPFQVLTPDVYEGAPTPVTALFSAGPKAAAFALLLRIFRSEERRVGKECRSRWAVGHGRRKLVECGVSVV